MASNWQYATLSAGERLNRIREGDLNVYSQEVARTHDVIKSRKELGLDVDLQLDWLQKLSGVKDNTIDITPEESDYKLKISSLTPYAGAMTADKTVSEVLREAGYSAGKKSESGYRTITGGAEGNSPNLGGDIFGSSSNSSSSASAYERQFQDYMENQKKRREELKTSLEKDLSSKYAQTDAHYGQLNAALQADAAGKKADYYANAVSRLPAMYEKFANSGLSFDGGRARSEQMAYNNTVNRSLASIDAQALSAANANNLSGAAEKSKAYSDYANRLAEESARIDNMEYQMMRDLRDDSYKQNQLDFEKYKYQSQSDFDKYKYETQMKSAAEEKTLEQERWEKEFGIKLDAQTFDKLLKEKQITLESDKFIFDQDKYNQEYELKLKQYADESAYREKEYDLKVDVNEFNKMLDALKYDFDIEKFNKEYDLKQAAQSFDAEKFSKEYELKQSAQNFDVEKFNKEYDLKQAAQDFDIEKFNKEYDLKQAAQNFDIEKFNKEYNLKKDAQDFDVQKFLQQYALDLKELENKQSQTATQNAQWEREMALKEMIQASNMSNDEKDYALKYLELDKKYSQNTSNTSNSSSSQSSQSTAKTSPQTSQPASSSSSSSSSSSAPAASSSNAGTGNNNNNNNAETYEMALTTGMWMKTQYSYNGKNTTRKYLDGDIDTWISSLKLTASEKDKLRKALGLK